MDNALCVYFHVVDDVECNMPHVCENASISAYPHAYDDICGRKRPRQVVSSWEVRLGLGWIRRRV